MIDESVRAWDEQAETFDVAADYGLRDPPVRAAWRDPLCTVLPRPTALVADVGCGTGSLSVLLASAGYDVTGVDFSINMIALANAKAVAANAEAEYIVGDAADPPLPAAAFDVVLSRHVLWAMPDPAAALTRWVQLLRPAGRLILIEGCWSTGVGLTVEQSTAMVRKLRAIVTVLPLIDPALWVTRSATSGTCWSVRPDHLDRMTLLVPGQRSAYDKRWLNDQRRRLVMTTAVARPAGSS